MQASKVNPAISDLMEWLQGQWAFVSAISRNDGTTSLAASFPNDVNLYVEVEADGGVEACVTYAKKRALDIDAKTLADLTPERVMPAVRSMVESK